MHCMVCHAHVHGFCDTFSNYLFDLVADQEGSIIKELVIIKIMVGFVSEFLGSNLCLHILFDPLDSW